MITSYTWQYADQSGSWRTSFNWFRVIITLSLFIYLFIYGLFYYAPVAQTHQHWMMDDLWVDEGVEGDDRDLIWGTILEFAWRDWGISQTLPSEYAIIEPRFEPGDSQIRCRIANLSTATFGPPFVVNLLSLYETSSNAFVRTMSRLSAQRENASFYPTFLILKK
jgi:hypothetical protein